MNWLRRLLQVWIVVCILLVVVALVTSTGEPVCEGPLILGVDDSDPPQCDDPISALPTAFPVIAGFGLVLSGLFTALGSLAVRAAKKQSGEAHTSAE
jgi:hypothetical protein